MNIQVAFRAQSLVVICISRQSPVLKLLNYQQVSIKFALNLDFCRKIILLKNFVMLAHWNFLI